MVLILGNKNYSTWSWRAWLAFESFQIPREEKLIPLDQPDTEANILKYSPSARVPCLIDGKIKVWDSLAICEYLAETFPNKQMWPEDRAKRARARSICSEMHSSFNDLRAAMPGNIRVRKQVEVSAKVAADIKRIEQLWNECLVESSGPFLFGDWSIADCFYAPVVLRFQSYGVSLKGAAGEYCNAVLRHPALVKLQKQAAEETLSADRYDKM